MTALDRLERLEQQMDELLNLLRQSPPQTLLTATEKATQLRVSKSTVYGHAEALGAVRVGRALRFPSDTRLVAETTKSTPGVVRAPRRASQKAGVELLPIGGAS